MKAFVLEAFSTYTYIINEIAAFFLKFMVDA